MQNTSSGTHPLGAATGDERVVPFFICNRQPATAMFLLRDSLQSCPVRPTIRRWMRAAETRRFLAAHRAMQRMRQQK
ncbi:hypothetical protein [Erwinia mallotivora]|uniref:hypothetical protein n=1 Tax=Erwinia mallotivora TaxID=69222 RepID=UPI0021C240A5|nr:hypothetical protein [Erwinia mallotivora]